MEEKNVHDDGRDEGQRERHKPVHQEENSGDQLDAKHDMDVVGGSQCDEELNSRLGHRLLGNEMQKSVESEDDEYQTEQDARDQRHNLHGEKLLLQLNRYRLVRLQLRDFKTNLGCTFFAVMSQFASLKCEIRFALKAIA